MKKFSNLSLVMSIILMSNLAFSQAKIDACFEYFVDGPFDQFDRTPTSYQDVQALSEWFNPSEAHPNVLATPSLIGGPQTGINGIGVTPLPPNNSGSFIGLGVSSPAGLSAPKVSYIATNLLFPLEVGEIYDFEFLIGSAGVGFEGGDFLGNIILLGCNNCSMPLIGSDCKEDELIVLGKKQVNVGAGIWFPNKLVISFTVVTPINTIVIGPGCNPWPTGEQDGVYYIMLDDLCIKKSSRAPLPRPGIINPFKKDKIKDKKKW